MNSKGMDVSNFRSKIYRWKLLSMNMNLGGIRKTHYLF